MQAASPIVGILSGMGPYAGLDLAAKVHTLTAGQRDQDHLPVALCSYPGWIPDRSTFLFDPARPSPVPALAEVARRLHRAGATVLGMPCNTAHAPAILEAVEAELAATGTPVRFVHMIRETARTVRRLGVEARVGVLSSTAVYELGLYKDALNAAGLEAVRPTPDEQQTLVNPVIFDPSFGVKAQSEPVTAQARKLLTKACERLQARGAEMIVLGCTEFPLVLPQATINSTLLVDPTTVLARRLIEETYPEKLRPAAPYA